MSVPNSEREEKIAKLLAKAEGTDNPNEAESYTKKAERLMIAWGVEEALVRAKMTGDEPAEKIIEERLTYTDTYSDAFITFGAAIVSGLGQMQTLMSRGRKHPDIRHLYVIGFESDVKRAVVLLESLRLQAVTAMHAWWRTSDERHHLKGWRAFKARRQFIMSFGYTAGTRLADTRHQIIAETGGEPTALVLRDRGAHVEDWISETYGELGRGGRGLSHTLAGAAEGAAAGRRADIGTDRLPGERLAIDEPDNPTTN